MLRISFFVMLLIFGGCSPGFYLRAAYEEGKILWGRDEIEDVIADAETTAEESDKLKLVLDARDYAIQMGLNPKDSFTQYSRVEGDALLWVLAGAKKDSFSVYEWWFPFVGRVPYKGYFEKYDAQAESRELHKQNFETFIRGSDAFSTLGWFNDPVLTTTLRNKPESVVNTVIHECVHSTVWIPGNVPFNESLANFVGHQGALEFYQLVPARTTTRRQADQATWQKEFNSAEHAMNRELFVADVVQNLYQELEKLYNSDFSREKKIELRSSVFLANVAPLRQFYPELTILSEVNNAEIMQFKFYLSGLRDFQEQFGRCNSDWVCFIEKMHRVRRALEQDSSLDPFKVMSAID